MKRIISRNPATGRQVKSYQSHSSHEVSSRVDAAVQARKEWAAAPVEKRSAALQSVAAVLRREKESLARLMAFEMGKPVTQGRAEIEKCAVGCEYFAAEAPKFLARQPVVSDAGRSFVCFEPLGVILGVMPWNFPFWQVLRAAAPVLMVGNAFLLKHASNVTGCSLAIEDVVRRAGVPAGLLGALLIGGREASALIAHPSIRGVTFTGSTAAGRIVGSAAGHALKKAVLELGGSDAYVVLGDADLPSAARVCASARLVNSGQSCIAAKRMIVEKSVAPEFTERLVAEMAAKRMGDPLNDSTEMGPMARVDLRRELHQQVLRSVAAGARLVLGGKIDRSLAGAFYPPTVLTGVRPGMAAFDEETFGPVAAVIEAEDERQAVELANRTPFGLGGAVFTRDVAKGERLAAGEIEAGSCFVNDSVRSDPRLPFGGVKESGFGRELSSFGMREFVNIKTVWVK
jgi:succinate-semialdehyde dehydrogenase/glutarate-semialdehyde dehydrogenase